MSLKQIKFSEENKMQLVCYYDEYDKEYFLAYAIKYRDGAWREAWGNMKPLKYEPISFWLSDVKGDV